MVVLFIFTREEAQVTDITEPSDEVYVVPDRYDETQATEYTSRGDSWTATRSTTSVRVPSWHN